MFCALKGATRKPSCRNMRQKADTKTLFPTWDAVPCTISTRPAGACSLSEFIFSLVTLVSRHHEKSVVVGH